MSDLPENAVQIAEWSDLTPDQPAHAEVAGVDLVVIRWPDKKEVSVLFGRCQHRGALMADGEVSGQRLTCKLHGSTYRYTTGKNIHYPGADLHRFNAWIDDGAVFVDKDEVSTWEENNPQKYNRDEYLGAYQDFKGSEDEPHRSQIQALARGGLEQLGAHGPMAAMGVPSRELPQWKDLQILTAQLHRPPLLDDAAVDTEVVVGPNAEKPLTLSIPLMISDMSFGALSREAKVALATGAEAAGTGICSGEGGMLDDEQTANSRYFYELASAQFGFSTEKVQRCQAFHFKGGQAAKTGTGGHLPGSKVTGDIAEVRGLEPGEAAVSPARFPDWTTAADFRGVADEIREATGGIPIGFKLSAQHIERDIDTALDIGVDYLILDGRGGGTGAAPKLFRDHISVPTIPALARARRHLDRCRRGDVTLIITGGLRVPADFIKALALGADAIALSTAAMHAIGCLAMRACDTNFCPVGIATQKPHLRKRLIVEESAARLERFLLSSVELMKVMARACGHDDLQQFRRDDLTTWDEKMARLSGVAFAGIASR